MKMIEWLIAQYKLEVNAKTEVLLYPHVLLVLVTNHFLPKLTLFM